jgi:multisubunit Na+/H+ antiporter MnhE subunit
VTACIALLSYIAFFYAAGRVPALSLIGAGWLPLRVAGQSLAQAGPIVSTVVDRKQMKQQGQRNLIPLLRGALLALPVLIVFTALLASADLIFAQYVEDILDWDIFPDLMEGFFRILLIGGVAWLLTGGLALALQRRDDQDEESWLEKGLSALPRALPLGLVESLTILLLVDGLFALFTAVQFAYLFGGEGNIVIDGYTYAEYARRGYFELVTVAILSLLLILGLNWLTRRESKRQMTYFNTLGSIMVGFVLVLLISAFQRMRLYEAAYGYTELRLYVYVSMTFLALVLGWFIVTLWWRPDRFAIGVIVAAIGFVVTLNFLNPDAFIARQNLAHYQKTGDLDLAYLSRLSDDVVPQLIRAQAFVKGDTQDVLRPSCVFDWFEGDYNRENEACYAPPAVVLNEVLNERFTSKEDNDDWRQWQSFHLSRWRAYRLLQTK